MSKRALAMIALLEAVVIVVLLILIGIGGEAPPTEPVPIARATERADFPGALRREASPPPSDAQLAGSADVAPPPTTAWQLGPGDPLRIVVYGSAATADGEPVAGLAIWLRRPDGTYETASATEGAFVFVGVEPGRYNLSCRADGYTPPSPRDVILDARESSRREDLVFTKSTRILVRAQTPEGDALRAKALEAHLPVDQWAVVATREAPAGNLPLTTLRNHDEYGLGKWLPNGPLHGRGAAIPEGYLGRIDARVAPPFFLSLAWRHVVLGTVEVREVVEDVTFTIPLSTLLGQRAPVRLRVVDDETGDPLPDVHVNLSDAQSSSFGPKTDENGMYEAEHHPPGLLQLSLGAQEYAAHWQIVRLEGGRSNDLGTIRLRRARTIQGRVVDVHDRPVKGRVTWRDPALMTFPQELHPNWGTGTDDEGGFALEVGPQPGLLLFSAKGRPPVTMPVDAGGDVEDLEVVVPDGVLVRIRPRGSEGWHHLFAIETAEGLPLFARRVRGPWPIARHLASGRYVLRVHAPDGTERRIPILVEGEELEVTVEP